MRTPEELEQIRKSCRGTICWEISCGHLVWYISAKTPLAALQKWREVAKRPAELAEATLKVRATEW